MPLYRQPLNKIAPFVFPDGSVQDSAGTSRTEVDAAVFGYEY